MRTLRPASEAEVLQCFRDSELLASWRWRAKDVAERLRQWDERDGLFGGLPRDLEWERVGLVPDEVLKILYINWDWWLRVSNGTRLASVAAEIQGRDEGDRAIAVDAATNPELIAIAEPDRRKFVLLEGHVRLTVYGAFPEYLPHELEIYLGISPNAWRWCQW
jgi:hypothetical protein